MQTITLSFDNGPDPAVTPRVLDLLAERGLKATFFVLGSQLGHAGGMALAARAHAEGHWIGNHTWSHSGPFGRRAGEPDLIEREIERTQSLIGSLAQPRRLYRPQGGGGALGPHLLSGEVVDHLCAAGYTCVTWNAVPRDWKDATGWVDRALRQCQALAHSLVVLHDLPTGAMDHLPRFLDRAAAAGASFVQDFPEDCVLIECGRPRIGLERYVTRRAEERVS